MWVISGQRSVPVVMKIMLVTSWPPKTRSSSKADVCRYCAEIHPFSECPLPDRRLSNTEYKQELLLLFEHTQIYGLLVSSTMQSDTNSVEKKHVYLQAGGHSHKYSPVFKSCICRRAARFSVFADVKPGHSV